jgi:hypothetical protein
MTTRKVRAKQAWRPESAIDHNVKGLAADAFRKGPDRTPERPQIINPCTAAIKNSTGGARRQFEAVALDTEYQLTAKTRENIWIDGVAQTEPAMPIAILLEPVADGKWCNEGQLDGVCPALVNLTDVSHTQAYLPTDSFVLESCPANGDVEIVQHTGETGEQVCTVIFMSAGGGTLVAFELATRAETVDDFPQGAYLIDGNGNRLTDSTEPDIQVYADPVISGQYGPALGKDDDGVGFRGWAVELSAEAESESEESGTWYIIVHMQRFARFIRFSSADFTTAECQPIGQAAAYWDGESPSHSNWQIKVDASAHPACNCLPSEGIAVLDERQSAFPYLWYRVVEIDQMVEVGAATPCSEETPSGGERTKKLYFGDGLSLGSGGLCGQKVTADGLTVTGVGCADEDPEAEPPLEVATENIRELKFRSPFGVEVSGDCPAEASVYLAEDLVKEGECIEVKYEDCRYTVGSKLTLHAGAGIAIGGTKCDPTI